MSSTTINSRSYLDSLMADQRITGVPGRETREIACKIANARLKRLQHDIRRNARQAQLPRNINELQGSKALQNPTDERARLIRETLLPQYEKLHTCLVSIERSLAPLPTVAADIVVADAVAADIVVADAVAADIVVADAVAADGAIPAAVPGAVPANVPTSPNEPAKAPAARVSFGKRIGKAFSALWDSLKFFGVMVANAFNRLFNRGRA
jgi:hypothetical protein